MEESSTAAARRELVRSWLAKAERDLAAARKLASEPDPYLDTAIYHCQQAAEKALKGFLVAHGQKVVKTHDVRFLVRQAAAIEKGFSDWSEQAERVTPYATAYRYPDEVSEPDREEFDQAMEAADGICAFVSSVLPDDIRSGRGHSARAAHSGSESPGEDE